MRFEDAKTRLLKNQQSWRNKKALRTVYKDYFREITKYCVSGSILEVGGGFGSFKEYSQSIVSTDILQMPNLDVVCDAHYLPFSKGSFNNVVAIDVLHHLERPLLFFQQVAQILEIGGRLVLIEPAITPISRLVYAFHDETVDTSVYPLEDGSMSPRREPFDGNQAIGALISGEYCKELEQKVPNLRMTIKRWKGAFGYPLSGGFRRWSLIPHWIVPAVLRFEDSCLSDFGPIIACRMILVYQRT